MYALYFWMIGWTQPMKLPSYYYSVEDCRAAAVRLKDEYKFENSIDSAMEPRYRTMCTELSNR